MSKDYLESLERLAMPDELHIKECKKLGIGVTEDFDTVEKALLRLEAIDNANPSEALECLEDIYRNGVFISEVSFTKQHPTIRSPETNKTIGEQCDNIKQALLKAQELKQHVDELKLVEKSLKALEIIKEKRVNVGTFIHLTKILKKDYEQCKALNNTFGANICETEKEFLTEEEFNLLKEVLE